MVWAIEQVGKRKLSDLHSLYDGHVIPKKSPNIWAFQKNPLLLWSETYFRMKDLSRHIAPYDCHLRQPPPLDGQPVCRPLPHDGRRQLCRDGNDGQGRVGARDGTNKEE